MTAPILALPTLFAEVQDRFTSESTNVAMTFGWREPSRQAESLPRIVWVPGDDGNLGDVVAPRLVGAEPERALANLDELFTVYLDSADDSDPTDEMKQYTVTRLLFDAWYRAIFLAASAHVTIRSARWITDKKERANGAALRVVASIEAVIPDAPITFAPRDTSAAVTSVQVSTVDQTETISPS